MHIMLISACQKRALKKTRAILDSYAPRVGERTWAAPMTMEGLKELHQAMRKIATRQTAVACYINHGRRSMKLLWTVGSKHRFDEQGRYPVGSTQRNQLRPVIPDWIRAASLLAGAAGDMHDIGKASRRFQRKLDPTHSGVSMADQVRHEWLSLKLLQRLRHNGWDWRKAWTDLHTQIEEVMLGERKFLNNTQGLSTANEAVDYMIVTHHGLLASGDPNKPTEAITLPTHHNHVRQYITDDGQQFQCAGALPERIFQSYQKRMQRLQDKYVVEQDQPVAYWAALALHSRAALIFADHTISAIQRPQTDANIETLFANTINDDLGRRLNQTLAWHLEQVGERAARVAVQMHSDLSLGGLCEQSVERITARSTGRFTWQNRSAQALTKLQRQYTDQPALVLNIAGTGSGKTRMNLRAICCLCPENPRVAIALNLRSLTLQTGSALKNSIGLDSDELAVVIGDKTVSRLYQANQEAMYADDDENQPEPEIDAWGVADPLPEWLQPLFQRRQNGQSDQQAQVILTAPLLVSTIDYLIAAGEPNQQGRHVKALLRLMSSDLILDEIDSYDPSALVAVLRLIQTAAFYGRRVICSSATLSMSVAERVEQAFNAGLRMRQAVYQRPQHAIYAILDDLTEPEVWLQTQGESTVFQSRYQAHLTQLEAILCTKPDYRVARLQALSSDASFESWQQAALDACQQLHQDHAWLHQKTKKRISIGLVRVAHVRTAIRLSRFLSEHYPAAQIACYHANDWLISRHYKETVLDRLLSRQRGSQHLQTDTLIGQLALESEHDDLPLIVVATPVEEVGRDHCFDWGVIDVSSCQSLVQTAGRVNRHRLTEVTQPNIAIMQFNAQYCLLDPDKRNKTAVFCFPGYENNFPKPKNSLKSSGKFYPSHDLAKLLPWSAEQQLKIDARLRFNTTECRLADLDDRGISGFVQSYYHADSTPPAVFSDFSLKALGVAPYQKTPLRAKAKKQMFYLDMIDEEICYFAKEWKPAGYGRAALSIANVDPHFERVDKYQKRAWLSITPAKMIALCQELDVSKTAGCSVELRIYQQDTSVLDYGHWTYDVAFGLVRRQKIK